jgi:hypothetical protein
LIGTLEATAVNSTKIFRWPRLSLNQTWENPLRWASAASSIHWGIA